MFEYSLIGNGGNESATLIMWAKKHLPQTRCVFICVDTGWAAKSWAKRMQAFETFTKSHDVGWQYLPARHDFQTIVKDRGDFPSPKFQWCASFLKGLTINGYLDEIDRDGELTVLLPHTQYSHPHMKLDTGKLSAHYGDRMVQCPLLDLEMPALSMLWDSSGLAKLGHYSLECDPCIHSNADDARRWDDETISKTVALEREIGHGMAHCGQFKDTGEYAQHVKASASCTHNELKFAGCGQPWACGL